MKRKTNAKPLNRASVRKAIRELFSRASSPEVVVNSFADVLKHKPATLFDDDGVSALLLSRFASELSHEVALEYIKRNAPDNLERFAFGYSGGTPNNVSLVFVEPNGQPYPVIVSSGEYRIGGVPDTEIIRVAGIDSGNSGSLFIKRLPPVSVVSSLAFEMAKYLSMPYGHRFRTRDEAASNAKSSA